MRAAVLALAAALVLGAPSEAHAGPIKVKSKAIAKCAKDVKPPAPRSREFPDAVKVLPPERGAYAGLYSIGTTVADYGEYIAKTGRRPAIVFTFHDWISDADFAAAQPKLRTFHDPLEDKSTTPLGLARTLADDGGRVLAVAWAVQCCDWGSMAWWLGLRRTRVDVNRLLKGEFDAYIRTVAEQIKAFGRPIMLSLFSEFNMQGAFAFGRGGTEAISDADDLCGQYGDPSWPDGPERVRDAHRHVIDLFRAAGVKNVTWFMYAASRYMDPSHDDYSEWLHPKYFYPGDDYIDWVGQSAYFVDPAWTARINEDAAVIDLALRRGYDAWGSVTQRPLILPEFGPVGNEKTNRAAVLRDVLARTVPALPRVKALTMADFLIAEICCQAPRIGRHFPEERAAMREMLGGNPYYLDVPRTGRAAP